MSRRQQKFTLYVMNNYQIAPTTVQRSLFLSGHAECRKCGAHVRPNTSNRAMVRIATASTATAWCTVCGTATDYTLEPRRAV